MKKIFLCLAMAFALCLALTGCGGDRATDYDIEIHSDGSFTCTIKDRSDYTPDTVVACNDYDKLMSLFGANFNIEDGPVTNDDTNLRSIFVLSSNKLVYENGATYLSTDITVRSSSEVEAALKELNAYDSWYLQSYAASGATADDVISYAKNCKDFGVYTITAPGAVTVTGSTAHVVQNSANSVSLTIAIDSAPQTINIKSYICAGDLESSSMIPVQTPAKVRTYSGQFRDVPDNAWYKQDLIIAYECGLFNGTSDTTFLPDGKLGVEEAVVVAARIHSIMAGDNHDFTAQSGEAWYQPYFDYADAEGIVEQAVINHFAGDMIYTDANGFLDYRDITRCNMAYVFAHALTDNWYEVVNENPKMNIVFGEPGEDFARYYFPYEMCADEVEKLYKAGILTGSDAAGTMYANRYLTRAEAVAIVARLIDVDSRK